MIQAKEISYANIHKSLGDPKTAYTTMGEYNNAIKLYEHAIRNIIGLFDEQHPTMRTFRTNLENAKKKLSKNK